MDKEKIGKFLCNLRKERKMTQENIAKSLFTSRENISKWERGINLPTPDMLLKLSKLYGASVNEILLGERGTDDNREQLNNISLEVLKDSNRKIKKIVNVFITTVIIIIIFFLIYYFINNYNSIHIYLISGYNEKVSSIDGIAIFSKEKSYIKVGNIIPNETLDIDMIQFLFLDNDGKEHIIVSSNDLDYTLTSLNNYNQYFSYNDIDNIRENSYLRIYYNNSSELIRLIFNEDMSNNHLFSNNNGTNIKPSEKNIPNNDSILKYENYFKNYFNYNKNDNQYYKIIKDNNNKINIYYSPETFSITIFENSNKIYIYNISDSELQYEEDNKNKISRFFTYDCFNQKCIEGNCDESVIKYFLEKYLYTFK